VRSLEEVYVQAEFFKHKKTAVILTLIFDWSGPVLRDDRQPWRRDELEDEGGRLHDQRVQRPLQVRPNTLACLS